MSQFHPLAHKLSTDLDRLCDAPAAVAMSADAIHATLDAIERDHPAESECVAFTERARLALDRMCSAVAADASFVAALDLQHLRQAVHEAVSVSRAVHDC